MSEGTVRWPRDHRPTVATAGRFFLDDRGYRVVYSHPGHLAVHLHEYRGSVRIGRRLYRLRPGDVTVSPPDTPSAYDLSEPGTHLCLHLSAASESVGPTVRLPLHLPAARSGDAVALRLQRIIDWFVLLEQNPCAGAASAALAQELLLWLAQPQPRSGAGVGSDGTLRRAVLEVARLIETDPLRWPGVPELAQAVGMSQNYLARGFKQHFGVTIPRYRLTRRLQLARELLMMTNLPVKAIAARVGIADPHHFNKAFRAVVGRSPSQWRRSHAQA